jgi:SAM-dependent methyltransferase
MDIQQLQRNWNKFGKQDPLWAILARPEKRGKKWKLEEFLETGISDIRSLMEFVESLGVSLRGGRALDFGCGVGRLTQALTGYFQEVDGVDIAPSMVQQARRYNQFGEKVRYHVNGRADLQLFADCTFDLIYSKLVLQHIRPVYAKSYIQEFVRLLASDGLIIFQLPSHRRQQFLDKGAAPKPPVRPSQCQDASERIRRLMKEVLPTSWVNLYRTVRDHFSEPCMEMHTIPREEITDLLEQSGGIILDIREQVATGPGFSSYQYTATKKR